MSWSIDLTADRHIAPEDVDKAVREIPVTMGFGLSRQGWGWSHDVDIHNPDGNCLVISGAGYSRRISVLFALALKGLLVEQGYKIEVKYNLD